MMKSKTILLFLFPFTILIRTTSTTALSSWCNSQGTRAWYLGQSCYTLTTDYKSYVDNADDTCTEQASGAVAMLTTTDIIQSVCTNLLQLSSNSMWFVAFVQFPQSPTAGRDDDWFLVDSLNNTYGRSPDLQWAPGEPDDEPTNPDGYDHNGENCVVIDNTGVMRDTSCTASLFPAVCQYKEPTINYLPRNIGNKVISTSTAIISGQIELPMARLEWCSIMCKTYASCGGFSINKSLITCTLLFKYNVDASDLEENPDYEIYGLF